MNFNIDTKLYGWIQGFLAVFVFLGINQVVGRYCTVVLEVNPVIYSCTAFISCALILLTIGGSGPLAKETMRSVDTWVYGSILMLSYIVGMILYNYITSTELTMLQKVSVGISLFGSWFFIGRVPDKYQVIGAVVVSIGVLVVAFGIDGPNKGIVYFLSGLYGVAQAARVFTAELHRPHTKAASMASDPRAKTRVIGFVLLVVSSLFLFLTVLMAFAQESLGRPFINGFPMFEDFIHTPSIFSGLLTGILLMAPLRVLEFSSARIIKAENFMVILTFTTVATLFWEWVSSPLTGLNIKSISEHDVYAIILITLGGLLISLTRKIKKPAEWQEYIAYSSKDIERVSDSREIIANTLEHFKGNIAKAADALHIPKGAIEAVLMDDKKVLAFKTETLKDMFPTKATQTRLGGDEFCVLLLDKAKDEAEKLIHDIQEAIAKPFTFEGQELFVTASMGVASYPNCSKDPEELLKIADGGMYEDKES